MIIYVDTLINLEKKNKVWKLQSIPKNWYIDLELLNNDNLNYLKNKFILYPGILLNKLNNY